MATTWIVAADASRARVLQVLDREHGLAEVETLENPEGRMHDREIAQDAEPRFSGHGGLGKPGVSRTSGPASDRDAEGPVERGVERFAKRLGSYLDQARSAHRYDRLHLIAPPRFLGLLRREIGGEVEKLVSDEVPKDLSWLSTHELEKHFKAGS